MIRLCLMNEGHGSQSSLKLSLPLGRCQYLPTRFPTLPPEVGVFLVAILDMEAGESEEGRRVNDSLLRQSLQSALGRGLPVSLK